MPKSACPSSTLLSSGSAGASSSENPTSGSCSRRKAIARGSSATPMEGSAAMVTWPRRPSRNCDSSLKALSNSIRIRLAMGSSSCPEGVSTTCRVSRSNSRAPNTFSAIWIVRLSAGCDTNSVCAAARKLHNVATRSKASSCCKVRLTLMGILIDPIN
ncbi:hypothetical protein FQZ97_998240 [compost metagenome]